MALDLSADAATFGADFGETLVYHPQGGDSRSFTANVERDGFEQVPGADGHGPNFLVPVPNSATLGISRDELNIGQDEIELAVKVGEGRTRRRILDIVSEDAGILTLTVA